MANIFPKGANKLPLKLLIALILIGGAFFAFIYYYLNPAYMRVGYSPVQPVSFSHAVHVGQLGMDCRYCHTSVDKWATSSVPDAKTCMACHSMIKSDSPALAPIREAYKNNTPVKWVKIHKAPDYVYFNHAVHVNRGISCVSCHGNIDQMEVVGQMKPLSMQFCLDCHRNPEAHIRPLDKVTDLNWKAPTTQEQLAMGTTFVHDWKVLPPQSCSGCHR
jgi:hypothetical protein